jgi:hypothetical protein
VLGVGGEGSDIWGQWKDELMAAIVKTLIFPSLFYIQQAIKIFLGILSFTY